MIGKIAHGSEGGGDDGRPAVHRDHGGTAQENGHGLVCAYGFALGALAWAAFRTVLHPDRDLRQAPRRSVASLTGLVGRRTRGAD
ncbi:hypothetical protein DN069_06355 [Streptacidiphilus pinicola]|uniref:Uncharacterized protein n=1 Tax=Streptacidiphilus pinicola TaxID=2219663 RepID=A0A2X0IS39_9ACTN|nr:hypothetical protein [Streptacidiphilus pinicola]RAG86433.1 hypothetical protein DN069_06355 [Streptacidiphilus pinicola]